MTARLAFRSAIITPLTLPQPINTVPANAEACICLHAGPNMASGTEAGNSLKFRETVYTFPDNIAVPGDGAGTEHRFIVNS
jgi:hypothetical protein